jgi:hypothetical protein
VWWDDDALNTNSGLAELTFFLKKRLGIEASFDNLEIQFQENIHNVQYKMRCDAETQDLGHATSMGWAISSLLAYNNTDFNGISTNPLELRDCILNSGQDGTVSLDSLISHSWEIGIPVFFLNQKLPSTAKCPMGMSINVHGSPVVILSKKDDLKATQLFILAHELGHIALGHLEENGILADEEIGQVTETLTSNEQSDDQEIAADRYAMGLLRGENIDFTLMDYFGRSNATASGLASRATKESRNRSIDVGHLLLSYAYQSKNWTAAISAFGYLKNTKGAFKVIDDNFKRNFDENCISSEDYNYLVGL